MKATMEIKKFAVGKKGENSIDADAFAQRVARKA